MIEILLVVGIVAAILGFLLPFPGDKRPQ